VFAGGAQSTVHSLLYKLAQNSVSDYHHIGKRLKVSQYFVSLVEDDYGGDPTRVKFEILARWYDTLKDTPDTIEIYESLREFAQPLNKKQNGNTWGEYFYTYRGNIGN